MSTAFILWLLWNKRSFPDVFNTKINKYSHTIITKIVLICFNVGTQLTQSSSFLSFTLTVRCRRSYSVYNSTKHLYGKYLDLVCFVVVLPYVICIDGSSFAQSNSYKRNAFVNGRGNVTIYCGEAKKKQEFVLQSCGYSNLYNVLECWEWTSMEEKEKNMILFWFEMLQLFIRRCLFYRWKLH